MAVRVPKVVEEAVCRCVAFKAGVVARDQEETKGVRECLNYGHTLAHAIEAEAGYGCSPAWPCRRPGHALRGAVGRRVGLCRSRLRR